MAMESVEARVARGAAWLDVNKPGWERSIDLSKLNMPNPDWCICGQAEAWLPHPDADQAVDCGFLSLSCEEGRERADYEALDRVWRLLLKERFDTGDLSDVEDQP